MALFTLFCRRPTTKALFNFTARRVLSVAALRTESDTTGEAESSARAPKLGAAVAMLNNSKDREEEEKDMKIKRNFVGWTIRNAAHRPQVDFVFFDYPLGSETAQYCKERNRHFLRILPIVLLTAQN